MKPEQIKEYAELKEDLSNHINILVPFSFFAASLLMFISALIGKREHNWFYYFFGILGLIVLISQLPLILAVTLQH